MKPSKWKIALSYLYDQLIETASSEYNEELYLLLVKGRYQLVTDKVIYSFEDKYDNFFDLFKVLDLKDVKSCLILGFGLGSIPVMLEQKFGLDIVFTGIEIDEEIVYLASKYVLDDLHSQINLIHTDAENFMAFNEEEFDMICSDVFINDEIPDPFRSIDFLEGCKASLSSQGMLLYNTLYLTEKDKIQSRAFFNDVFKNVFPKAKAYHCGNNLMLVSSDHGF